MSARKGKMCWRGWRKKLKWHSWVGCRICCPLSDIGSAYLKALSLCCKKKSDNMSVYRSTMFIIIFTYICNYIRDLKKKKKEDLLCVFYIYFESSPTPLLKMLNFFFLIFETAVNLFTSNVYQVKLAALTTHIFLIC